MFSLGAQVRSGAAGGALVRAFPLLIVFDLDMCLWSPEMYTLDNVPTRDDCVTGRLGSRDGEAMMGIVGCKSGYATIKLFDEARLLLQDYHFGRFPPETRIAAASSADTPRAVEIGRAAMDFLEIVPGVTMRSVFQRGWPEGFSGHMQIGRTPPLSSDKAATHFPLLQKYTNIKYKDMIFFDDCNWGDHVGNVERAHGVIGQRTPRGITKRDFDICVLAWQTKAQKDL
jgi:magnesium-dependent phosphatase 1